ncbi:MAG: hypothetical protein NZ960_00685 [Candidatus Kapabacteria bacterium]|nr:hypothetical protein [Candidatus Kapabacteria bacterium]MDW8011542.1 FlgD immunoglobulin-like domain containing protein [Bacteroidota bacterium]
MERWLRLFALTLTTVGIGFAQRPVIEVSGRLGPDEVRIFLKDTIYRISGTYMIAGTLIIEPGTIVEFLPNGRLIVSVGGRIIADGYVSATYNQFPGGCDPADYLNPCGFSGYADLNYFQAAAQSTIIGDPTIDPNKYGEIFLVDLGGQPQLQGLPPGKAIMYAAARLHFAASDPNINRTPWRRAGGASVNVTQAPIIFRGRPVNNFSREWGHIIILPGTRAAFFRNVIFENFRKDTTVDRFPIYQPDAGEVAALNRELIQQTNGSGGAITSFSSRTWLLLCEFRNNTARYRGGALQLLQAPPGTGVYPAPDISNIPFYPQTVNPYLTENATAAPIAQSIRAIDQVYSSNPEPLSNSDRQAYDDARLAVLLGRVRYLTFTGNRVLLSSVVLRQIAPGVWAIVDNLENPAPLEPQPWKNEAYGGAVYIAGRSPMEIGLGINDFEAPNVYDYIFCDGNTATNLQNDLNARGARGGAIYVGRGTSLTVRGRFVSNQVSVPFFTDPNQVGALAQGGAIYTATDAGRLQVRGRQGGEARQETHFIGNQAGRGGAICVDTGKVDTRPSPVIGGSDALVDTRNYGYNIKFRNNRATEHGGAVFSRRNLTVYGAGGTVGPLTLYGGNYPVEFDNNTAGFSGGAISIQLPQPLPIERRYVRIVRAVFTNNIVGQVQGYEAQVRGGGAVYTLNADLNVVKGVEFRANKAFNGNGGAVCIAHPFTSSHRFFLTDVDDVNILPSGVAIGFTSRDDIFTWAPGAPVADVRMLTRFFDNEAIPNMSQMGSGTTQIGDIRRLHPGTNLRENGTGLGGAIYIVDEVSINRAGRTDSIFFNRVRIQGNRAYTGAAIYSDNYNLQLVFTRSLITNNTATSEVGARQNAITGPLVAGTNAASSDLAGAVIYGNVVGPHPYARYHFAANSIYDNTARFLIRLPDYPDTKGALAGTGVGMGGVDTLQGNYWGRTEANVVTILPVSGRTQETFFVAGDGTRQLGFVRGGTGKNQGPFESRHLYSYTPIPVLNAGDENTPDPTSIPERLLMQGLIYDIFDKGTDIKTADYSNRRMSPIEDFAVGIPKTLRRFTDPTLPSFNKYVRRWTRNPFDAESDPNIGALQTEFRSPKHPIGYPLFLEARADYSGSAELNNNDPRAINETVFFVINTNTGDYIRVNLRQTSPTSEVFRARVELVPDSVNRRPIDRRTIEGLANIGTNLAAVLAALRRAPDIEDRAALQGRKYEGFVGDLGGPGFGYVNRILPADGAINPQRVTVFAGERYSALPVRVGDVVAVVSRTVLWQGTVADAIDGALIFEVGATVDPPVFTGNKVELENITPPELRNMIFLMEDISYPRRPTGPGRDSIFTITAVDSNLFYDPRSVLFPDRYPQLAYFWSVPPNSGLSYWLQADTLPATYGPYYGARGYVVFKGRPTNPFVVPGGEVVTVAVRNYPPSARTVDSLKAAGLSNDVIARYIYLYPPYFNAQAYDGGNARFLQQDTVDFGNVAATTVTYQFRIFVIDSTPRFTTLNVACERDGLWLANLTDSLRFRVDVDTDDELEDAEAGARGWDFRYGRTTYGFASITIRDVPPDTVVEPTTQVRPVWMQNQYLRRYDNSGQPDPLAIDFSLRGQLNVRIDSATAVQLLTPATQYHRALNTDTIVSIVVNDGHGGVNYLTRRVLVNVAPVILTNSLPDAVEDQDYNPTLLDSSRRIVVYDPNFGQAHRFELIYPGDPRDFVPRDPCFPEAGAWDLRNKKTTPRWLQIDPVSGLLYGTPGVYDAPRREKVTVLVTDEFGLTHVKVIDLNVRAVNHPPRLTRIPAVRCVEQGKAYVDTIAVVDRDLLRQEPPDALERLTIEVIEPAGFQVSPATVNGPQSSDTVRILISTTALNVNPGPDGKITVRVRVVDREGAQQEITYKLNVSEPTDFVAPLRIENRFGAFQILEWGTAPLATTGSDPNRGGIGRLDSNYCEYELPPIPPNDVFDARWTIPSTNGTARNIFPRAVPGVPGLLVYTGRFQAGSVTGNASEAYPVRITWNSQDVPDRNDATRNPAGSTWYIRDGASNGNIFSFNMRTGEGRSVPTVTLERNGDSLTVVIRTDAVTNFVIVYDLTSDVSDPAATAGPVEILENVPNPFAGTTRIRFRIAEPSAVQLEVYDALGGKVKMLLNGFQLAGEHAVAWDGTDDQGMPVPSGVYYYRVVVGGMVVVRPMVLVR